MLALTPVTISAASEAWTAVIAARPAAQVSIIGEIAAGWLETIRAKKGLFSTSIK
jgi:phosphatidylinositol 4-kinase